MKIGNVSLESKLITAPMAGVTDYPFRQILREFGAELVFTEMVSAMGLLQGNQRTRDLLDFNRAGGLIGVQLFGSDPTVLAEAAVIVENEFQPDIIDINFGCPAPKVVNTQAGAAFMKSPDKVAEIVTAVVNAVNTPVTVKIRKGWNDKVITALEVAKGAEQAGAQAITIHGRTRAEFYSGEADWDIIKRLAEAISVPLIGNGDIFTAQDAKEMLSYTGADGIMIARGMQGNPWLIKEIRTLFRSGCKLSSPTDKNKIDVALDHLEKSVKYYGETRAVPLMRKHLSWYIKGMPHAAKARAEINQKESFSNLKEFLREYKCEII
ncbi:MAG: tRNA dihydrouridine synthase DusB [Bacillota bacterium]